MSPSVIKRCATPVTVSGSNDGAALITDHVVTNHRLDNSKHALHEKCIVERALHEQEIRNRLKRLNDRKLQIQECKVQEVKAANASLGDRDNSEFVSNNRNAYTAENVCNKTGNDQSLGKQSSTYGNESTRSRNEYNERSRYGNDTNVIPS
ncbi:hypothetical protein Tco_0929383 [Tanacetum coccineum]